MEKFTSKTQKIGQKGENIAEMFLVKHGFLIIDKNFTRKMGEIDIVAKKNDGIHFVEVKTVTCETLTPGVSHEIIRPEENMTYFKIKKLLNTIEIFLLEKNVSHETKWQLDLICVYLDHKNKKAKVKVLENIIF